MTLNERIVHAAVDVSKAHLDVFYPQKGLARYANTDEGIHHLLTAMQEHGVARIEMEATGGYEKGLEKAARKKGLAVCLLNALRVRQFARSQGLLAKTDALDAKVIHLYAESCPQCLRPRHDVSDAEELLAGYVLRRQQLSRSLVAEKNRMEKASHPQIAQLILSEIRHLEKKIEELDGQLRQLIGKDKTLNDKAKQLRKIDGVGEVVSSTILALMPELGRINRRQAASLAGVAPMNHDSGQLRGERHIHAGRQNIRRCLYMAALTALRCQGKCRMMYLRLRAHGKAAKVAITACMRLLIVELNASMRAFYLSQRQATP